MFINHKMTHRYIYFRFTRHALQLHHVTMLNYLHGYKCLCCQNLAYRQTEIKWSFFVEHLNSWLAGTHESHENWHTTNKNEFTVINLSWSKDLWENALLSSVNYSHKKIETMKIQCSWIYTRKNVTLSRKLIKHWPRAILNSTYM
jgi:hypothetical protein